VLTDGNNEVTLPPHVLVLEADSPELEAKLLKAANGPHAIAQRPSSLLPGRAPQTFEWRLSAESHYPACGNFSKAKRGILMTT
jgi:hypothetical protein